MSCPLDRFRCVCTAQLLSDEGTATNISPTARPPNAVEPARDVAETALAARPLLGIVVGHGLLVLCGATHFTYWALQEISHGPAVEEMFSLSLLFDFSGVAAEAGSIVAARTESAGRELRLWPIVAARTESAGRELRLWPIVAALRLWRDRVSERS